MEKEKSTSAMMIEEEDDNNSDDGSSSDNNEQNPTGRTRSIGIVTAVIVWIVSATILASMGFSSPSSLSIAGIIGGAVFGGFMLKIYLGKNKEKKNEEARKPAADILVEPQQPELEPQQPVPAPATTSLTPLAEEEQEEQEHQRCLILAAPTHAILQDRMNYWLKGGYGDVTSSSMAVTEKGFYLTIFYRDYKEYKKEIIKELTVERREQLEEMPVKKPAWLASLPTGVGVINSPNTLSPDGTSGDC